MKSTGKIELLTMAVTIIFSVAAEGFSDGDSHYCYIDFTEELTGAEARLQNDLFQDPDPRYLDRIKKYYEIEHEKCHDALGDYPLLLSPDGETMDDWRNAIAKELTVLKGAINLTIDGAWFVQDQKANNGMSNDAQKCDELICGMKSIVQTLSDYLMYNHCGCESSTCDYDPDAVVLPERNTQESLSDAAIQLFIPYAKILTGVNTLDCKAAFPDSPDCGQQKQS